MSTLFESRHICSWETLTGMSLCIMYFLNTEGTTMFSKHVDVPSYNYLHNIVGHMKVVVDMQYGISTIDECYQLTFILFICVIGNPGIYYAGDTSRPVVISKPGIVRFELWPEFNEISWPTAPHVCEILGDGTVQTSTVLAARPPYFDTRCIIPFGRPVWPFPTVYIVDVPVKMKLIPTGPNSITWQIFLSREPCISGKVILGVKKYETNQTGKFITSLSSISSITVILPISVSK